MRSVELGKVGKKIRQIRKERGMNLQEVAEKSDITAGLLSRIENFRTLPSLPVLHKISLSLSVTLADLVEQVDNRPETDYIYIPKGAGEVEEREDSVGVLYENILSSAVSDVNLQTCIVTIPANTYRKPLTNDSMELLYVISGKIQYGLGEEKLDLSTGDTLYFDGSIPHSLHNTSSETTVLFKVYLLRKQR
jgi:transcriptional regulator with XRE-family HTH domain